ncbi:MAG TPA: hypothetical protein VGL74_06270 [Terriglobales bacterium]|jgi:hypothetical protein
MKVFLFRSLGAVIGLSCLLAGLSCAHDQQLVSIAVQPGTETFGDSNTPVSADAGLSVQLRALGHYIHPPVTKDITNEVVWGSNDPQIAIVNSTGLLTATGDVCGGAIVSATVTTNTSTGNRTSSGALVTSSMTANVVCFTGTSGGTAQLTISFLGTGTGSVTVSPPGTICQTTCGISYPVGTGPIMLTAATSGVFGGWGTNCSSAIGTVCTINSLTTNTDITVTFN